MDDPQKTPPINVLVIDDEPGLRDMLTFGLSNHGYRVVTASNGDEGIAKIKEEAFELAVCDILMAGKTGLDVLREAKKIRPEVEFIMATGHATLQTAIEAMKLGAYDYITKPYGIKQLCGIFEKALEHRRLQARVSYLEEVDRLKSEFLANTSHELRTPLNALMGFVALLLHGMYGDITPEQAEILQRAHNNGKNLLRLINNMLDMSKITAGKMMVLLQNCDVAQLARTAVLEMESLAMAKQLKLTCDAPLALPLQADGPKFSQILINLIGNGIKFTDHGGVDVSMIVSADNAWFETRVKDTGIGIKASDIPLLFQEFRQLDSSATRQYGGTGLGLCFSKKLAQLMGGDITVESQHGVGTTFIVRLPATPSTNGAVGAQPARGINNAPTPLTHAPGEKRLTILLAEDDPDNRRLVKDTLEPAGYRLLIASDGMEALKILADETPDLLLLDLTMPKMTGWDVARHVREHPKLSKIKIVAYSAHASGGSPEQTRQAGFDDYLYKPCEPAELTRKVAAWLQNASVRTPTKAA